MKSTKFAPKLVPSIDIRVTRSTIDFIGSSLDENLYPYVIITTVADMYLYRVSVLHI